MSTELIEKLALVILGWSLSFFTQVIITSRQNSKKRKANLTRLRIVLFNYKKAFALEELFFEAGGIRTNEASFARLLELSDDIYWQKEHALRKLPPPPRAIDDQFLSLVEDLTNLEAEFGRFEIPKKLYKVKETLDIYFDKYQQVELFINQNSEIISIPEQAVVVLRELRKTLINTVDDAYQAVAKESYISKNSGLGWNEG
jgi:hypothetical protein